MPKKSPTAVASRIRPVGNPTTSDPTMMVASAPARNPWMHAPVLQNPLSGWRFRASDQSRAHTPPTALASTVSHTGPAGSMPCLVRNRA